MFGGLLLPERQRAPQGQKLHPPHILNEPLSLLYNPAPVARMFGGSASSLEAKNASRSEAPSTSHSERATFAFVYICYNSKIEEGRYMPKGSGKVIAQNKKLFMIISSKKHTKQGLSFKERKLSQFALDA